MTAPLHGIVAIFATPDAFVAGLRQVRQRGYSAVEVHVPFAVEGMDEWLPGRPTPIARIVLLAALSGGAGGFFLQWYATRDYPLDVGGRPVLSWPAFIPVTFELTVLTAAVTGVIALFWLCGLPRLDHPMFGLAQFARASQDRYFLGVRADDPRFDRDRVIELLGTLGPESVAEVRP